MSALRVENLSYRYPGADRPALDSVSLEIDPGEFVVCAGLSASGKSTLLRAACGLVPHFHGGAVSGRVTVGGLDTREHQPGELAAHAGTLLQDPETQVVMGTVGAELAFPLENQGLAPSAVARGVEEVALALGIGELLERPVTGLSGGELQRVALGAALATRPPLVLLDEPASQLDPVAADELTWMLRRLNEEWGTAVLLVEHRLERCLAHADRVVVLDAGSVAFDGGPRAMLEWAAQSEPALQTPAARLFERAGLVPAPTGVRDARATLVDHGLLDELPPAPAAESPRGPRRWPGRSRAGEEPAVGVRGAWRAREGVGDVLRAVDLSVAPGETVALMGRNGAGKSTLLRIMAGIEAPERGRVEASGPVALLLQNPGDYLLSERAGDEVSQASLEWAGLADQADRHPRDLSGGERQRLALALIMEGESPAALLLDEPTRGMDRAARGELLSRLRELAGSGVGVVVATHDAELAAVGADRVVLLSGGRPVADGPPSEVLCGGWHFSTETARILGGAGGACTPEQGGDLLRGTMSVEVAP